MKCILTTLAFSLCFTCSVSAQMILDIGNNESLEINKFAVLPVTNPALLYHSKRSVSMQTRLQDTEFRKKIEQAKTPEEVSKLMGMDRETNVSVVTKIDGDGNPYLEVNGEKQPFFIYKLNEIHDKLILQTLEKQLKDVGVEGIFLSTATQQTIFTVNEDYNKILLGKFSTEAERANLIYDATAAEAYVVPKVLSWEEDIANPFYKKLAYRINYILYSKDGINLLEKSYEYKCSANMFASLDNEDGFKKSATAFSKEIKSKALKNNK